MLLVLKIKVSCERYIFSGRAMKRRKIPYFTVLLVIFAIAIFYLSSYPMPRKRPHIPFLDKIVHFAAFSVFYILTYGALRENGVRKKLFLWAFLIGALYGAVIEIYQYFVPYRECSLWDWLADISGEVFAALVVQKSAFRKIITS